MFDMAHNDVSLPPRSPAQTPPFSGMAVSTSGTVYPIMIIESVRVIGRYGMKYSVMVMVCVFLSAAHPHDHDPVRQAGHGRQAKRSAAQALVPGY